MTLMEANNSPAASDTELARPLCVDLDGTFTRIDTLPEIFLLAFKQKPWVVVAVFFWLLKGKAYLKSRLANLALPDVSVLPLNPQCLHFVQEAKKAGRTIWLVTGSYQSVAERVAAQWPYFDGVLATTDTLNLTGRNKARKLNETFGEGGYDYMGNSGKDHHIWAHSHTAIVVNGSASLEKQVASRYAHHEILDSAVPRFKPAIKALRVHQWLKNLLVFLPLLTSHRLFEWPLLMNAMLAFVAFGLVASPTYVLNDLLDIEADRHHATKSARPFASGHLSVATGIMLMAVLLPLGIGLGWLVSPMFLLMLLGYVLITVSYSFWLKRIVMVDVLVLALLYTWRVGAGAVALETVAISFWLILFSIFVFFSLALVKRVSELDNLRRSEKTAIRGRGYHVEDLEMLQMMGVTSGFISILVLALYLNSEAVKSLYTEPAILWLVLPVLLFWFGRIWLITHRGNMHEDPVVFAAKDKVSMLVALIVGGLGVLAKFAGDFV